MIHLAKSYGRYGYRKVLELLRIEGWRVNHKNLERLWSEEGLQQPQRHKKRKRLYHHDGSIIRLRPTHPNHVWSVDFVHDKLSNGRRYKMLTVLDEYTREALGVAVAARMGEQQKSWKRSTRCCYGAANQNTFDRTMVRSLQRPRSRNG